MDFRADHVAGMLPEVLEAIAACNNGFETSYGGDKLGEKAKEELCDVFQTKAIEDIFFVATGTAANCVALACLAPPYGSILCASGAHIHTSECNGPEFYSGCKLTLLPQFPDGRIKIDELRAALCKPHKAPHEPLPSVISITQPTETGSLYSLQEVRDICSLAKQHGLKVHMDGARFASAVAKNLTTEGYPASVTWQAGVDCLTFGSTKNGTMCCEVVIFFGNESSSARGASYRIKRGGHLLEKSRFLSAQLLGYLNNDGWIKAAQQANASAALLGSGISEIPGCQTVHEVVTNLVYVELPKAILRHLAEKGYRFSLTAGSAEARGTPSTDNHVRLRMCTTWDHKREDIERLLQDIKEASQNEMGNATG